MRLLQRKKISPISLRPGDTIELSWNDGNRKTTVCRHTVDKYMSFNEAAVFEVDEELGWDEGLGGAFGLRYDSYQHDTRIYEENTARN